MFGNQDNNTQFSFGAPQSPLTLKVEDAQIQGQQPVFVQPNAYDAHGPEVIGKELKALITYGGLTGFQLELLSKILKDNYTKNGQFSTLNRFIPNVPGMVIFFIQREPGKEKVNVYYKQAGQRQTDITKVTFDGNLEIIYPDLDSNVNRGRGLVDSLNLFSTVTKEELTKLMVDTILQFNPDFTYPGKKTGSSIADL